MGIIDKILEQYNFEENHWNIINIFEKKDTK